MIFLKMEDGLNFLKKEGDLNLRLEKSYAIKNNLKLKTIFSTTEDNPNYFGKRKMT